MNRSIRSVLAATVCALTLGVAEAEPGRQLDPQPWLDDFAALKAGMEDRYANLAWFGSPAAGLICPP
jgi:hypothetical protein